MASLACKDGVQPQLLWMAAAVANVAATLTNVKVVTITAGLDGQHKPGSKHYQLAALDLRTHNFPSRQAITDFQAALVLTLGADYDVLLESPGTPSEHLHVEFDPR